jgi:hypothetical protein
MNARVKFTQGKTPTGPEDVEVTTTATASLWDSRLQCSSIGIPVDTFSGSVDYNPVLPLRPANFVRGLESMPMEFTPAPPASR